MRVKSGRAAGMAIGGPGGGEQGRPGGLVEERESLIWVTRTSGAAGAAHYDREFVKKK